MSPSLRNLALLASTAASLHERRLSNRAAKVNALPDEVLLNIFMQNTDVHIRKPHRPSEATRRSSHVCASWRHCALSRPDIWVASLDFSDPLPWLKETIMRTGSRPVDVVFPSPFSQFAKLEFDEMRLAEPFSVIGMQASFDIEVNVKKLVLALSLFPRARTFILAFGNKWKNEEEQKIQFSAMVNVISKLGKVPAPYLNTFSLNMPAPVWNLMLGRPLNAFASQIRHLGLCSNIENVNEPPACFISSWLNIIGAMKGLESLELDYYRYSGNDEETSVTASPMVNLHKLEYLKLRGNYRTCYKILEKLNLRPSCGLNIDLNDERDDADFYYVMSAIGLKVARMTSVYKQRGFSLVFGAFGMSITNSSYVPAKEDILSLNWHTNDDAHYIQIFQEFCRIMKKPGMHVESLQLTVEPYNVAFRTKHFGELLKLFPNIKELRLVRFHTLLRLLPLIEYSESSFVSPLLTNINKLTLIYFKTDDGQRRFTNFTYKAREDFIMDFVRWRPQIATIKLVNCGDDFPKHLFRLQTFEENV